MTTPALGYIPPMTKGITDDPAYVIPVSYTHLTLPTICSV